MHLAELRAIAFRALVMNFAPYLRHQRGAAYEEWEGVGFTRSSLAGPGFNFAAVTGPTPSLDRILEHANGYFQGVTGGFGILVEADLGHPVEDELLLRRWVVAEDEPALIRPTLEGLSDELPPGLEIVRGRGADGADVFARVLGAAFGVPPEFQEAMRAMLTPELSADPDAAFLIGTADGKPVAGSMMTRAGPTAIVGGVGALPECRRRGVGAAMTVAAMRAGAEVGCVHAALRSGPMSFNLYCRLGFVPVSRHRTYIPPPAATA
jgi:ribosomal protein S18 acetylase RimI-like enzyme